MEWDVLGFGAVTVDDLVFVPEFPRPDSKMRILEEQRHGGGLTGTALVAAVRLGASAAYCGVLGYDELSRDAVAELKHEGIDCSRMLHKEGARPIHATILVEQANGRRTILFSTQGWTERQPEEMDPDLISSCRVLFVDHTVQSGGIRAAQQARRLGIPVVGDFESAANDLVVELMGLVDHLIIGSHLSEQITGYADPQDRVRALMSAGRACCVVTQGEQGCWYAGGDSPEVVRHFPAFPVKAVDTTGCGDVFHGAYAAGLAHGMELEQRIRTATAAAGIKAMQPGGRSGIPRQAEVIQFLSTHSTSRSVIR